MITERRKTCGDYEGLRRRKKNNGKMVMTVFRKYEKKGGVRIRTADGSLENLRRRKYDLV